MSGSGVSVGTMLCDLLDQLRKQHRGGITPSFGQVDELFELGDRLRADLQVHGAGPAVPAAPTKCAMCPKTTDLSDVILGERYCPEHVRVVGDVMRHLSARVPGVAWPAGEKRQMEATS